MADNILSSLTPKQKITGVILVAVVGIIVWQVMGLFSGSSSDASAPQMTGKPAQTSPNQPSANTNTPPGQPNQPQMGSSVVAPQQLPISNAFLPSENRALIEKQQKNLGVYIDKVNKLQSLKIEREIAEMSQAIAAANLSAAKSDKDLSNLLTAPAQLTAADYAGKLAQNQFLPTGVSALAEEKSDTEASTQATAPSKPAVDYVVVSISMQLDKWTAVLGYQGKLYSVKVGDTLPADNAVVSKITSDSVTLTLNKKDKKINMLNPI